VYGDGSQTRSFCYVDDLVEGLIALLDSSFTGPVNVGNDDERTMLEVAELVREMCGSSSDIVFTELPDDDPTLRRPDLTRARTELGWQPSTPFEVGLARTIEWFSGRVGH
jgi:nucleoside-diphosphate-sugar epimerase